MITKKEIKLAKLSGFCYGVKRAVDLSIKTRKDNPDVSVCVLGQLIHNNQVIEQLENMGITTINEIPENIEGICIIRAHGATPETIFELQKKGCQIVDTTCPDVKHVQDKAGSLAQEGYKVVIIGKADHPEVIAIKANADLDSAEESLVISSPEEAEIYLESLKKFKKVGIVVQTTQKIENFKKILSVIAENAKELKLYNTICSATSKRQHEAKALANNADLMIVVGSKSSANTTHLAEILNKITDTIHIETEDELEKYRGLIDKASKIGVTAGASTPDFVAEKIIEKIEKIGEK